MQELLYWKIIVILLSDPWKLGADLGAFLEDQLCIKPIMA